MILAERYDNPAASVTTNYVSYARQVCYALALDRSRVIFFECYRDPASPDAYPYHDREKITFHRVAPMRPSSLRQPRWRPVDNTLRETLLSSLITQHDLTYSYRTTESWEAPGEQTEQLT